jgi:hypothetical protein
LFEVDLDIDKFLGIALHKKLVHIGIRTGSGSDRVGAELGALSVTP